MTFSTMRKKMEIYCKDKRMLASAMDIAEKLNICDIEDTIVTIKRLPPSFTQKGIIEYPRYTKDTMHIDIFIKYDAERYVTLAHEMVHLRQVLTDGVLDENEAYLLEKTLLDT